VYEGDDRSNFAEENRNILYVDNRQSAKFYPSIFVAIQLPLALFMRDLC